MLGFRSHDPIIFIAYVKKKFWSFLDDNTWLVNKNYTQKIKSATYD